MFVAGEREVRRLLPPRAAITSRPGVPRRRSGLRRAHDRGDAVRHTHARLRLWRPPAWPVVVSVAAAVVWPEGRWTSVGGEVAGGGGGRGVGAVPAWAATEAPRSSAARTRVVVRRVRVARGRADRLRCWSSVCPMRSAEGRTVTCRSRLSPAARAPTAHVTACPAAVQPALAATNSSPARRRSPTAPPPRPAARCCAPSGGRWPRSHRVAADARRSSGSTPRRVRCARAPAPGRRDRVDTRRRRRSAPPWLGSDQPLKLAPKATSPRGNSTTASASAPQCVRPL